MKTLYALLLMVLLTLTLKSQTNITGQIVDDQQQSLAFANILLLSPIDSSLVKGNVSDENGNYIIEGVQSGNFLLSATMIGYQPIYRTIEIDNDSKAVNQQAPIQLIAEATELETAIVTAQKPLFEQRIDRLIVNIKNSVTSTGNNALEVLARSPGVRIDGINNEITLDGNGGVLVQINDKPSRISGDALIQLLKSMPADNIEKIELISTPPASYDAEGTGGIINIVLVKNLEEGVNGNFSVNTAYGLRPKFGASTNLNIRKGKVNIYSDFSANNEFLQEDVTITKAIRHEGTLLETESYSSRPAFRAFYNARLGLDYELSKKTTLGILVSGYTSQWRLDAATSTTILADGQLQETSNLRSIEENNWWHGMANISLRHTFSNKGKLSLDYDYLNYQNDNPTDYTDRIQLGQYEPIQQHEFISRKENPIHFHVFKADYTQPLNKKWNMELGVKSTMSNFMNDNLVADLEDGEYISRPNFTDLITMDENILAGYFSTDWQISDKTSAKAGIRYEHTDITLVNRVETLTTRNYGNWFPSVFLSHNFNEHNSVQLSYSKRIWRPSLNALAPAFFFFSPNALIAGNPQIQATVARQFRASYRHKILMMTLQYSREEQSMSWGQPTIIPEENLTVRVPVNMEDAQNAMFFVSFPLQLAKWWEARFEMGVGWQQHKPIFEGEVFTTNMFMTGFNGGQRFILPKEMTIEVDGYLMTSMNYGLSTQPLRGSFNIGIRKKIGESSLTLNVQDVFNLGSFFANEYNRPDLNLVYHQIYQTEGSVFRLTYSHNFGNKKVKGNEQRQGASSEERGRVQ